MADFTRRAKRAVLVSLSRAWTRTLERGTLPRFANVPLGFEMRLPRSLVHPELMSIGTDVKLGPNSELKCNTRYPGGWMKHPEGAHVEQVFQPQLTIGHRVTATASLQVIAFRSVVIEDDVMFAANVFVADGTHAITTVYVPYKYQGVDEPQPVRIGRGAWIGQNVVINPGVTIGAMAVVGANSVVTSNVAPCTIVAGAPARVVRQWSDELAAWANPKDGGA